MRASAEAHFTLLTEPGYPDTTTVQCAYCDWREVHSEAINWPEGPPKGGHREAAIYRGRRHYDATHSPKALKAARIEAEASIRAGRFVCPQTRNAGWLVRDVARRSRA
jgi:hypothetical protein